MTRGPPSSRPKVSPASRAPPRLYHTVGAAGEGGCCRATPLPHACACTDSRCPRNAADVPGGSPLSLSLSLSLSTGRLFQVEYAMEAISQSGLAVGVLTKDGVVLAAEKRMSSKLLDTGKTPEKMYKIDDHVACAVAGITSDANILVNYCRLASQRYLFQYDEPVPLENLLMTVCDTKQGYTQYGGESRPSPSVWRRGGRIAPGREGAASAGCAAALI